MLQEQPKAEPKPEAQDTKPQDMETDANGAAPEAGAAPNGDAAIEDPMEQ